MTDPRCKGCLEKVTRIKELAKFQNIKLVDDIELYGSYHRYHMTEIEF